MEYNKGVNNVVADCLSQVFLIGDNDFELYVAKMEKDKFFGKIYTTLRRLMRKMNEVRAATLGIYRPP